MASDQETLAQILDNLAPEIRAMVEQRLSPALHARFDWQDILQKAYLRARPRWPHAPEAAGLDVRDWLFMVVRDTLRDMYRACTANVRDYRVEAPLPDNSAAQLGLVVVDPGTSPSEALARKEQQEQVCLILNMLEVKHRQVVVMRLYDQLPFEEIAEVLGITAGNARVRHNRALQEFKRLWLVAHPGGEMLQ